MQSSRLNTKRLACLLTALAVVATSAGAVMYGLEQIGDPPYERDLDGLLWMSVTDPGSGQVLFTIGNDDTGDSSVMAIYMDDGAYFTGIGSLVDEDDGVGGDPGVDFSHPASNDNFPEGNTVSPVFETTADFSADRDSGPGGVANGIDPGETLGIYLSLIPTITFDDVIFALDAGVDIRVGIHVQAVSPGYGSDSYMSTVTETTPTPSPVPDTTTTMPALMLATAALLALKPVLSGRRSRKS